jgi:hypothetical protein
MGISLGRLVGYLLARLEKPFSAAAKIREDLERYRVVL